MEREKDLRYPEGRIDSAITGEVGTSSDKLIKQEEERGEEKEENY